MFYSQFILAKKGPLGTIWIAAHLERKLRKNQVADTDIGVSVDSILFPEVPIALRLSSHLLLGVVRIYSRKVSYLFDDCSEALLKVKQAFRSTAVDLPPEQSKAPYHSITLPETFDLDDFELPDNEIFQGNFVDHHVSAREQITLQDTMDGVAFPTSQFGRDERFGDGDASQIGLDLDEDLFMEKGEAAGTSGILMGTDADPQASAKESSPFKGDEHNKGFSDPLLASPYNCFSIQAPSTPGLTEEPNFPSAQEALVSDDHMEEDQDPSDLVAKEVSGTAFSEAKPSNLVSIEFHSDGNCHHVEEQENEKAKSLKTESMELVSSGNAHLPTSGEHTEAIHHLDGPGNIFNLNSLENERNIAADIQSEGHCDIDVGINGTAVPVTENAIVMEVHGIDPCASSNKTGLSGTCPLMPDGGSENNKSRVGTGVLGTVENDKIVVSTGSESQNADQPSMNHKNAETSDGPNHPAECDGLCSLKISGRENATNVSGISTDVQDVMEQTLKAEQMAHGAACADNNNLDGKLGNLISEKGSLEKEDNSQISDLSPPEVLLSMPSLPAGQSDSFIVECTPGKEALAEDGDATEETIISGRKRSFTESILTIQSLNSVESAGAAQSKGSVEFIPDDDDLLSSILVGKRSTAFKMKPTPPLAEAVPAKRQRISVRSSAHKRKLLVDDTMVLHGDMIRQQLTNTEDIRRVRKKAPCTRLEVWMLQKQFLEDEIFNEPVFTGMSPALRCLDSEAFDLSGLRIILDDGTKGAIETVSSTRPMLVEETDSLGTVVPSVATGEGVQEHTDRLLEPRCGHESTLVVDGSTLQKETDTVDDGVTKEMSIYDVSGEKVEMEFDDVRTPVGGEANHSIATSELASSVGPVFEVNCNSTDDAKVVPSSSNKTNDLVSMHIDMSCQLLDQRSYQSTECASMTVSVSGADLREGVDGGVSEKLDSDERSDGRHLLEKMEAVDTDVTVGDFQETCSLPFCDVSVTYSVAPEEKACLTSEQGIEECQDKPEILSKDEILALDLRDHGSNLPSNNHLGEDVKLDSSYLAEADLNSQNTMLNERTDPEYWEAVPKIVMDSTSVPTEYVDAGNHVDFGADVIEHDTDFLNVDDDEVAEDYESDMPNAEERRILDNSGWSARTRAVANYLQVLFEKEAQHAKKVITLDSLLTGKSRKEASRMFFETLVLKTKDYIQAEQESSFCGIKIKPSGKLMSLEF